MNSKSKITASYVEAAESFGIHKEIGVFCAEVSANQMLGNNAVDRPIVLPDAVMVWVCRGGSAVVSVDGLFHNFSEGQMLVVFEKTVWRICFHSPDFAFSLVLAQTSSEASLDRIVKTFPQESQMPVVSLLKQENAIVSALMDYIKMTSQNYRNPSREEIDNSILTILRSELIDIFLRRNLAVREATKDEQMVKKFNMMLAVSCFEHRDVEHYASEFNIHPKRFAAKVKRVTGRTPSDLIASAVIKNAKRLLVSTELSSHEIAEKLNFATPSFFCRYFKRYVGVAPQEWREQNTNS